MAQPEYTLDLNDKIKFIALAHSPLLPPEPGETWVWPLEVLSKEPPPHPILALRPVYKVRDLLGSDTLVAFYTPNPNDDVAAMRISPGKTLVLKDARPKQFGDGRIGFRVEQLALVEVIPHPISRIRALNDQLRSSPAMCEQCGKVAKTGCSACHERYCSKECQTAHWPTHKHDCKTRQKLWTWNNMSWA